VLTEALLAADFDDAVVVAPDIGNAKRASLLARRLGLSVAAGNKRRIDDSHVVIDGIVGEINSSNAIILDDEIARGTSVVELWKLLKERGVQRVWVACTHGVFSGHGLERILEEVPEVQEIIATDTVPIAPERHSPKLRIASVAPLFAEAIRRIHAEESVSSLFDPWDA
jgi:ribose-phosphate pyrophosphokinase